VAYDKPHDTGTIVSVEFRKVG